MEMSLDKLRMTQLACSCSHTSVTHNSFENEMTRFVSVTTASVNICFNHSTLCSSVHNVHVDVQELEA